MEQSHQENAVAAGLKTTLTGILVSTVLAVAKALGGIFGNSYALIADAIESLTDIVTSGLLYIGLKWSSRPADKAHPYGHGKAEALIALGISLGLVAAAVIISVESIHNIQTPHKTPAPWTLIILLAVIVTKEILYRYVLKTGEEINSGAVKADAFHHRSDAITSAAAVIGIGIALLGGPGYEEADDWAALLAAVVIVINAYLIARPAIGELLDEDLDPALNESVRNCAAEVAGVVLVEKCHIRKMGIMSHADMHIWVNKDLTVAQGHDIAHAVQDHIKQLYPQMAHVHIHIEPADMVHG
ncbi:cobalt-zinc-cadmium resistance protein [Flavobacterium akiainvivens]|uniref:Cobalt-zinc-cadmium resistance protein n=1 Tax=Flavobacterium akiainvivens TaxID=1202724 RepID=A0A0M8MGY8_9FLAO|nr:cation diffusion facilitator family transporter [Flavobacterium akiainvivens]KOS06021.1 cobalt-zinc-cadmium resistance protein [Flavobacterium akiainvivens]SFQ54293.1 cation diffusion facilitator family transporter [Flavobacterium akiainvivens]